MFFLPVALRDRLLIYAWGIGLLTTWICHGCQCPQILLQVIIHNNQSSESLPFKFFWSLKNIIFNNYVRVYSLGSSAIRWGGQWTTDVFTQLIRNLFNLAQHTPKLFAVEQAKIYYRKKLKSQPGSKNVAPAYFWISEWLGFANTKHNKLHVSKEIWMMILIQIAIIKRTPNDILLFDT